MTLSDIKFHYQDKIDNVNARIERYNGIVTNYSKRIKIAEKEDNPNISSVIEAKQQYEHKITNLQTVKRYYKEFVDTSDYLMQYINKNENALLLGRNEDLQKKLDTLQKEYDSLVIHVEDYSDKIASLNGKIRSLSNEKGYLQTKAEYNRKRLKEIDKMADTIVDLKEERDALKSALDVATHKNKKLLKVNKRLHKKLEQIDSDKQYQKTVEELESKNKNLEEYCNHLLNRKVPI